MAVIVIENVPPYDGEHEVDLTYFTLGEQARIFDISKVRPVNYSDALVEADPRFRVALTVVTLERSGHAVEWLELFWQARPEQLLIDLTRGPGVPEPVPPASSPLTTEHESGENERNGSSGEHSATDGASSPESDPSATGVPGSATNAD